PRYVGQWPGEGFELEPLADHAGAEVPGASTGRRVIILVRAIEAGIAAVDRFDDEVEAVEGIELEIAEGFVEDGEVHVDSTTIIFGADFECVVDLRLEKEIRAR